MSPVLLLSGLLVTLPLVAPSDGAPTEMYVRVAQAAVRSGPGPQYYATDHLGRGTRVEVHRRDDGGWLAIRPPEGSYSLLPANQVKMTSREGVARVTDPQAVAWVATRHGPVANHKWQVRLELGEAVRILGEQRATLYEGGEPQATYRIAPPAGEFRWIHEEEVAPHPPAPASATADSRPEEAGVPALEMTDYQLVVDDATETAGASALPSAKTAQNAPASDWRPRPAGAPPAGSGGSLTANLGISPNGPDGREPRSFPSPDGGTVREMEVQLSLMVSQPPEQWDLTPFRRWALERIDAGETALERGRARLLLEKVSQFAEVQQRHLRLASAAETVPPTAANRVIEASTHGAGVIGAGVKPSSEAFTLGSLGPIGAPSGSGANDVTYDAQGILVPVHSRTGRAPPYALVDGQGQVLKYVSPSPGLNLHRYLGKRIGIMGQRGYLPSIDARHVTAQRVIHLDRHQR